MKSLFTPMDVQRITGLSYRQIQYWDKTNFISPSCHQANGYRLYTFADLVLLAVAEALRDAGVSIQKLRETINRFKPLLASASSPMVEQRFLFNGEKIIIFTRDVLMDPESARSWFRFDVKVLRQKVDETFPEVQQLAPRARAQGAAVAAVG